MKEVLKGIMKAVKNQIEELEDLRETTEEEVEKMRLEHFEEQLEKLMTAKAIDLTAEEIGILLGVKWNELEIEGTFNPNYHFSEFALALRQVMPARISGEIGKNTLTIEYSQIT